jgi:hypothetical protein
MELENEALFYEKLVFASFVFRNYVHITHLFSKRSTVYFNIVVERVYITRL